MKDAATVRIVIRYLTGDIMKHVKNVFLVLAFALSAAAFSASAMAASDTKAPPANSKNARGFPSFPAALIHENQEWCKKYPPGEMRPPDFCQMCQC
ncbi:hypothetical protein D7O34_14390 [Salmonella enterica subsp. enterica serovar Agama]|nr:hypothetical protein [Salmonella enterica subsp. enterica serovar Agama]